MHDGDSLNPNMRHHWIYRLLFILLTASILLACGSDDDSPPTPTPQSTVSSDTNPVSQARITVPAAGGAFQLDAVTLSSLGWTADTALQLTRDGDRIPLVRIDDTLLFYVPARPNPYNQMQALWLESGDGVVSSERQDALAASDPTIISDYTLEENHLYQPQAIEDPWFWEKLIGPTDETFTPALADRTAGALSITTRVRGGTTGEHTLALRLNGETVAEETWSGQETETFEAQVQSPPDGDLELTLHIPEADAGVDIVLLDRITISYPRTPRAVDDQLTFTAAESGSIAVGDVRAPAGVWRVSSDAVVVVPAHSADGQVQFKIEAGEQYVVAGAEAWSQPATMHAADADALASVRPDADYVVVAPAKLQPALEPLLAARREHGHTTFVTTPQAVYDSFSYGQVDPLAIRSFLRHARDEWSQPPEFVLLVGDATYDPFGYLSEPAPNLLPSPFIDTAYGGQTVSDNVLADLDEDGYPDLALGRIPARTPAQVERVVAKIRTYEKQQAADWQQEVVFVADGAEPRFKSSSEQLESTLPNGFTTASFYPTDTEPATDEVTSILNGGALLVNYVGHGSVNRWGKAGLLTSEVANQLSNGDQLPIYINMTCLTGLFTHPEETSLAESLLWAENGGAVAVLAPTSLTLPDDQTQLNSALLDAILTGEAQTIGEAVVMAKATIPLESSNARDVVATFNLLGDPALTPALPQ